MPFTQIATDKDDYMIFIGDGSIRNAEEFFEWCATSIKKAQECGHSRLLYDNRTLQLDLSQHDIMTVGDLLLEMGVPSLGLRFAVLSSVNTAAASQGVDTAFANRSVTYKRFDSQKDALKWLLA